jgi:hypothetical protein
MGLMVVLGLVVLGVQSFAAPVDSKESARAAALQKVETVLAEKAVADQLAQLGLSPAEARARLARLSDAQLEQLAAQVDLLQTGGTVQGAGVAWPVVCIFKSLGTLVGNIFRVLFCWSTLK